ncbi:DNA-binding protein [Bradyrhizobium sp. RDM4]|uniref:helix-turn-helix domain-containing transcriptional regulator n=1 Tax=Bradyrhizobium sp. RDM4 TaxID=3378765 RepID=UPI0038FCDA3F
MSEGSLRLPNRRPSTRREIADHINRAFETSDITRICLAIGAAIHNYNVSDIANESGIARQTIYRAFARGPKHPNLKTVLSVLDAMGYQLHITAPEGSGAVGAVKSSSASRTLVRHEFSRPFALAPLMRLSLNNRTWQS